MNLPAKQPIRIDYTRLSTCVSWFVVCVCVWPFNNSELKVEARKNLIVNRYWKEKDDWPDSQTRSASNTIETTTPVTLLHSNDNEKLAISNNITNLSAFGNAYKDDDDDDSKRYRQQKIFRTPFVFIFLVLLAS